MPPMQLNKAQFEEMLNALVDNVIKRSGLDKIDRKHGMFPDGLKPGKNPSKALSELTKTERTIEFFRAVINHPMANYEVRALAEGTDSTGGFLVPEDFRAQIIVALEKMNAMRNLCFVIPMTRDTMTVPAVTGKPTASWTGERVAHTESDTTFGQVQLIANKLSLFSKMSQELLDDTAIEVESLLVRLFGEACRNEENKVFTVGSGVNRPVGVITHLDGGAQEISGAGAGTYVAEDVITLFYALASEYRQNAVWIMHNRLIEATRKMRYAGGNNATTGGGFIWTDGFGSTPPTLMGKPVYENNDMPTTRGAANRSVLLFGDFKMGYYIGDRRQMAVKASTEASDGAGSSAFLQDETWLKVTERLDGQVAFDSAIVMMDELAC